MVRIHDMFTYGIGWKKARHVQPKLQQEITKKWYCSTELRAGKIKEISAATATDVVDTWF